MADKRLTKHPSFSSMSFSSRRSSPAHQAMLRQVELSVGRPQTLHGNVHQVDHVPNGPTNSAAITTMFCGGKPLVAVTRERRYGPSRLRVNDDDGAFRDVVCGIQFCVSVAPNTMRSLLSHWTGLLRLKLNMPTQFAVSCPTALGLSALS